MSNDWSDNLQDRFGQAVKELRNERELSQEKLAECSGLHRTYIAGVESGNRNPSLQSIAAIAKGLDMTISALFAAVEDHDGRKT